MECKICGSEAAEIFNTQVLYKYNVSYYQCTKCDFVQTEEPYWLEEAYVSSMNLSDTGVMQRSERLSKIVTSLIFIFFNKKGTFLDYAGGLGVFTRAMRDIGFNYYWHDPYTKNELARGFEGELTRKYDLVTTFESFEHFEDPRAEVKKLLSITDTIILTTDLVPGSPVNKNWWYIAPQHGQHIAFHSKKSFAEIARQNGLYYYNAKNVHILTKKKLGIASLLFRFKFCKHVLYIGYYLFAPFMKSKSVEDMNSFYIKDTSVEQSKQLRLSNNH